MFSRKQPSLPIYSQPSDNKKARRWRFRRIFMALVAFVALLMIISLIIWLFNRGHNIEKEAYVTMITSDDYKQGAIALAKSVILTGTKRKLYCMITEEVSTSVREELSKNGCIPTVVDHVKSPYKDNVQARWSNTFTKLRLWSLTQFYKMVYIDADCVLLQNVDELFDLKQTSAAMDCCDHFNSGVMVLTPSDKVFNDMTQRLESGQVHSYDKADQGFLNSYFDKIHILPQIYNTDQLHVMHYPHAYQLKPSENEPHLKSEQAVKVLHYVHHKPWATTFDKQQNIFQQEYAEMKRLHQIWWDIYNKPMKN